MAFDYMAVLRVQFYHNTVQNYLIAFGILLLGMLLIRVFKGVIIGQLERLSKKTKNEFDDVIIAVIKRLGWPFYFLLALMAALKFLTLPEVFDKYLNYAFIVVAVYYAVRILQDIVNFGAHKFVQNQKDDEDFDDTIISVMARLVNVSLWIIALLTILANLGLNITGLLAGAGIIGLAIAFALQNVLTDLFASFSIYFDKPFKKGDFIVIGNDMGVVKYVGIKSTRLQTLQGQELVVSNRELTTQRVNNFKQMQERRIVFTIGVTYDTPVKKMEKIPAMIKETIESVEQTRFDRAHFSKYGDFSLNYEIVYYVLSSDYNKYMDINQDIHLEIKRKFEKEKIDFAFPTQTIYVEK